MDDELNQRLTALEQKLDRTLKSVELMRKITVWTAVVGLILFVLPLIGLAFVIPTYIKSLDIQQYLQ